MPNFLGYLTLKYLPNINMVSSVYLHNASVTVKMWHKVNFKAGYTWFEFRDFLKDWLPDEVLKNPVLRSIYP